MIQIYPHPNDPHHITSDRFVDCTSILLFLSLTSTLLRRRDHARVDDVDQLRVIVRLHRRAAALHHSRFSSSGPQPARVLERLVHLFQLRQQFGVVLSPFGVLRDQILIKSMELLVQLLHVHHVL